MRDEYKLFEKYCLCSVKVVIPVRIHTRFKALPLRPTSWTEQVCGNYLRYSVIIAFFPINKLYLSIFKFKIVIESIAIGTRNTAKLYHFWKWRGQFLFDTYFNIILKFYLTCCTSEFMLLLYITRSINKRIIV